MSSAYLKKKIQKRNEMDNDSLRKIKFLKKDRRYFAQRFLLSVLVLVRNK